MKKKLTLDEAFKELETINRGEGKKGRATLVSGCSGSVFRMPGPVDNSPIDRSGRFAKLKKK